MLLEMDCSKLFKFDSGQSDQVYHTITCLLFIHHVPCVYQTGYIIDRLSDSIISCLSKVNPFSAMIGLLLLSRLMHGVSNLLIKFFFFSLLLAF